MSGRGGPSGVIVIVFTCVLAAAAATAGTVTWNRGRPRRRMLGNIASGRDFIDALSAEVTELEAAVALAAQSTDLETAQKQHERKSRELDEQVTQVLTHLDKCVGGGEIGAARKAQIHRAEALGLRTSKLLPGVGDGG